MSSCLLQQKLVSNKSIVYKIVIQVIILLPEIYCQKTIFNLILKRRKFFYCLLAQTIYQGSCKYFAQDYTKPSAGTLQTYSNMSGVSLCSSVYRDVTVMIVRCSRINKSHPRLTCTRNPLSLSRSPFSCALKATCSEDIYYPFDIATIHNARSCTINRTTLFVVLIVYYVTRTSVNYRVLL